MKNHRIGIKICISLLSLIFFLCLLEIGLRITSHYYHAARINKTGQSASKRAPGEDVILCVGDSYTLGGEGEFEDSYPMQFQGMINSGNPPVKFSVVNGGWCESTSRDVLKRLPSLISDYNPKTIVLLTGLANRFNFVGYDFEDNAIKEFIRNLKIFKMGRILWANLRGLSLRLSAGSRHRQKGGFPGYDAAENYFESMSETRALPQDPEPAKTAWYYYNLGEREKAGAYCEAILKKAPDSLELLFTLAYFSRGEGKSMAAVEYLQKALDVCEARLRANPGSETCKSYLVYFKYKLAELSCQVRLYDLAVGNILSALLSEPELGGYYLFGLLVRSYSLQAKYGADDITVFLRKLSEARPYLKKDRIFMNYLSYFGNIEKREKEIGVNLKKDLQEIVNLCKNNGIRIIVLNYPYPSLTINAILRRAAEGNSLIFVDNCSVFNGLLKKEEWRHYFVDDGHCTAKGHRIMAKNLYDALVSGKMAVVPLEGS